MRAYVMTAGGVIGLIFLAHLARIYAEGLRTVLNPWFSRSTLLAAALCGGPVAAAAHAQIMKTPPNPERRMGVPP